MGDLPDLVESVRSAGLPVSMTISGDPEAVPPATRLAVYRVAQEALTNTIKHARHATLATVPVAVSPTEIVLTVHDDGEPAGSVDRGGHGLVGMRERASMCHGSLDVGPGANGGWTVVASIPYSVVADSPYDCVTTPKPGRL